MAVDILDAHDIAGMRRAGACAAATLAHVVSRVKAHFDRATELSAAQINRWVLEDTAARGATPSQLGYHGFPAGVCVSPNDVVCHGIPHAKVILRVGDIVNIDVTSCLHGYHGDTSVTLAIGPIDEKGQLVLDTAREGLLRGIAEVRPGARLGDIGAAIEAYAHSRGCTVVRQYGGHGIGTSMHQPPHVSHHGQRGRGLRLQAGMAFTIEPMITVGDPPLEIDKDGWTVRTADGSPTAQFEHTVLVTEDGAHVLTLAPSPSQVSAELRSQATSGSHG